MGTVEPAEARERARDLAALWSVGYVRATELVDAACDLGQAGPDRSHRAQRADRWAHQTFGHDTLALAERLVELDDAYDCLDFGDTTEQDLDAEVIAEARRIAAIVA